MINFSFSTQIDNKQVSVISDNLIIEKQQPGSKFQTRKIERDSFLYIVHLDPQGYIVISSDNSAVPILAYSFEDNLNINNIPVQLQRVLTNYNSQIRYLIDNEIIPDNETRDLWENYLDGNIIRENSRSVEPLIEANWNQGGGWNDMCPSNTYVGCVAVAMGQVMHHWQHPYTGTGFNMYYLPNYGFLSADFETAYYDFESMENDFPTEASSLLLYHAGIAVDMHYSSYGSGASVCWDSNSAQAALDNNFNYNNDITCMNKIDYSEDEWVAILKDQLDRGWPVIYRGYSESAGHAWNIDGYDSMDYFHCNWGWGGSSNGYFYLDPLHPDTFSFVEDQAALLNILPEGFEAPFALFDFEINNLEVTFDDLSGIVNADEIVNWFWDFGDGDTSNDQSPIYSYADYGNYEVSLVVRNVYGLDSQPHIENLEIVSPIGNDCELPNGELGFYDCELCCWDASLFSWLGDEYCDQFGGCAWEGPQFNCYELGYDCGDCDENWDESDPLGFCEDCPLLGDVNTDSIINVIDIIEVVGCILEGPCPECSDVNDDGDINIQDILAIVSQVLD